ncbi:MAG TPA: hypothetical protein VFR27_19840 [Mycobacterium sp.]|nr:hypothetical protein [Mycobacterium sp.]
MNCDQFSGGPGWGGTGFGYGSGDCGPGGFGRGGFGRGFGGPGFGHRGGLKRAAFGTAALLLDGPADAAQVVQRTTEATDGAFTPPQEVVEIAIGLLAARGFVTVDNGVATLTDLGKNILAWRGVTAETAHAMLGRVGKFAEVIKIRSGLKEVAGLARTIVRSGTDEQKAKLTEVRAELNVAITEAKRALHSALGES